MTEGHSSDNKKQSQRVMRSDGERRGGRKKSLLGERTSENAKDKKRKGETKNEGKIQGESGRESVGRDFITAIILRRQL